MCFTGFPTETAAEAGSTVAFMAEMRNRLAPFMCGRFGQCHGSRVAHFPEDYGIQKIRRLAGDELETGLFYQERLPSKSDGEHKKLDQAVDALSAGWWLHDYPWAGALSTAHTLLWYARYGADVFKRFPDIGRRMVRLPASSFPPRRLDIDRMIQVAGRR